MACGCTSTCGCDIVGDEVTAHVTRLGDKFTVSAIPLIAAVDDTNCIALDIDVDKHLTATLQLDPTPGSVELACGVGGLVAEVVPDPASSAIVSVGPDGLRVDVPPPPTGAVGEQPGDMVFYEGVGVRAGAIDADGSAVSRAGYPALHDAVSLYATTANRTSGDDVITGIASTRFMAPGMPIEATGFAFGSTIVSVPSSTSVQVSVPATDSGADTEVRVYPHGNGDGVSTFNVPDASDRYPLGYDYASGSVLGELGGGDTTLAPGNLPLHDHTASGTVSITDPGHDHPIGITDPGHAHTAVADGAHAHPGSNDGAGGPARNFIMSNLSGLTTFALDTAGTNVVKVEAGDPDAPGIPTQLNNSQTGSAGSHTHTINANATGVTADATPAATGITATTAITVDDAGSATPDPLAVNPKHIVGRWMVIT